MTRGEEIRNAIDTIIPILPSEKGRTYEQSLMATGFEAGAGWADEHPINVWHDVSDEPKINEDVVLYDCCGNFIAEFFDGSVTWRNIVLYYKATMWVYAGDLLPKGGEL